MTWSGEFLVPGAGPSHLERMHSVEVQGLSLGFLVLLPSVEV